MVRSHSQPRPSFSSRCVSSFCDGIEHGDGQRKLFIERLWKFCTQTFVEPFKFTERGPMGINGVLALGFSGQRMTLITRPKAITDDGARNGARKDAANGCAY
jgi:hypothetical protein